MRGHREAERRRQPLADVRPVRPRVVAAVHTPVVLKIEPVGVGRVPGDLVHALAELGVGIRQEDRRDTGVGRRPARAAVPRAEHPGGGDGDRHRVRVAPVGEYRVQPLTAAARHPFVPRRVLPQGADEGETLPSVLRAVQRRRFRARVHHVGLRRGRVELPHPLQRRPGVLRELHGRPRRLRPRAPEVVGVEDRRAPVRAVPSHQQPRRRPAGVDRDRVDRLRVEVRPLVELPDATPPAPDEQPLAGAHGKQNVGHADHLRNLVVPDMGQSAPHH